MTHPAKTLDLVRYIPTKGVCKRYRIVPRTLHRWKKDPDLNFPKAMVVNGRNYHDEAKLDQWDLQRMEIVAANSTIRCPAVQALFANPIGEAI